MVKYKDDPWKWWAVVRRGRPARDPHANDASVTSITNLTESEAYYLRFVAERMLAAAWKPNQSPKEREQNSKIIEECVEILDRYINRPD